MTMPQNIKTLHQADFADDNPEYAAFVDKFKPRKTTDDCYTPPAVYDVVRDWAFSRYAIDPARPVVRPFCPGGDYERHEYPHGCVVIDNPPFSILAKIVRFYRLNNIDFFLFAPTLTLFNLCRDGKACGVVVHVDVIYKNGAKVNTSFVTNLGDCAFEVRGDLQRTIHDAQRKHKNPMDSTKMKYAWPSAIVSSATLSKIADAGLVFSVPRSEALWTCNLDALPHGKKIYGSGFLISKRAAAERAAAERAAAERAAAENSLVLSLSERERAIQRTLKIKAK